MRHQIICCAPALFAIATLSSASMFAQDYGDPAASTGTTTTVTNATGTISQLNYGSDGSVEGFLLGTSTLITFPTNVAGGVASLGAVGNSVTYSGNANTNSSGFESVRVTSFTNNTTKATYSSSTAPTSTTYGPTSGTIKQLNYGDDGSIDAFVFTPSGGTTSILVETGTVTNSALKTALTVGAMVSLTGTTYSPAASMCTVTGSLTVVDANTLVIGGSTYVITGGGLGGGNPGGPGRNGHH
jgi:hypothetical protein